MNEYERQRLATIDRNKKKLESLGIPSIVSSMRSLVENTKDKKRKGKSNASKEDDEYIPDDKLGEEEGENEPQISTLKKVKTKKMEGGTKKSNFIPPMSIGKLLKMNKKQQTLLGGEALESFSMAMDIVQKAISNQQDLDDNTCNNESINLEELEQGNRHDEDIMDTHSDGDTQIGQGEFEDACPQDFRKILMVKQRTAMKS